MIIRLYLLETRDRVPCKARCLVSDDVIYLVETVRQLSSAILRFLVRRFFLSPPALALCTSVDIVRSGPAEGEYTAAVYRIYLTSHQVIHTLAGPMHSAAVPFCDFHAAEQRMVLMVSVYERYDTREKLLQCLELVYIVLIPDISCVARDYEHIVFTHLALFMKPEKRKCRAVLVSCNKNPACRAFRHNFLYSAFL